MLTRTTGLAGTVAALGADQAAKALVNANSAALADGVPVFPGFNLVYLRNDGVTFGLMDGVPWWALSALAPAIVVWPAVLMARAEQRVEALALPTSVLML